MVICYIAIENGHINSWFSHEMLIFHCFFVRLPEGTSLSGYVASPLEWVMSRADAVTSSSPMKNIALGATFLSVVWIYSSSHLTYLSTYLSIYLSIYLPTYLSISIYFYLSISTSISIYIYIYLYLSTAIDIYPQISWYLSIYLSIYLSLYIYISLHLSIPIYLYLSMSNYI